VAALLAVPGGAATGVGVSPPATESAFVRAINETRAERGIAPLRLNKDLVRAARSHSKDMVEHGYFEHGPFAWRLMRFGFETGIVGENLGWRNSRQDAVSALVEMWLRSSSHRAVLLNAGFRAVGVGIRVGPFKGWDCAIVVTVDFWSA